MKRRAAVTGVGAVTGFGAGAERLWAALLDGRRAMGEQAELIAQGLHVGPVALVPSLPLSAPARAATMALSAAREALDDAGDPPRGARFGIVCGTTLGGIATWLREVRGSAADHGSTVASSHGTASDNGSTIASSRGSAADNGSTIASSRGTDVNDGLTSDRTDPPSRWSYAGPAHALAAELRPGGPVEVPSVACASGNAALGWALDLIRNGRCDVVLAGGVDALHDFVISGFACLKALDPEPCRPFDRTRKGLNLGEAACFLVIESESHARARGARIRAFLDGYGIAADAVHMTGPDREGRGAARAMTSALADAGASADQVDYVSAHGTATVFNDLMESKALALALGERAARTPVNSIKSALGHTLGAAGALEALLCVRTLETGAVTPTPGLGELDPEIHLDVVRDQPRTVDARVALSTSSGFGGTNAAVLLRRA
jgi:3-oxoacyl-[acyl-carrier-protein] synthase II